jgi:hypothetical protein
MDEACMRAIRNAYNTVVGKLKTRGHFGDLGTDGRVLLKINLKKQGL